MLSSMRSRRRFILASVKFLSRALTALNFDPSMPRFWPPVCKYLTDRKSSLSKLQAHLGMAPAVIDQMGILPTICSARGERPARSSPTTQSPEHVQFLVSRRDPWRRSEPRSRSGSEGVVRTPWCAFRARRPLRRHPKVDLTGFAECRAQAERDEAQRDCDEHDDSLIGRVSDQDPKLHGGHSPDRRAGDSDPGKDPVLPTE